MNGSLIIAYIWVLTLCSDGICVQPALPPCERLRLINHPAYFPPTRDQNKMSRAPQGSSFLRASLPAGYSMLQSKEVIPVAAISLLPPLLAGSHKGCGVEAWWP